MGIGAWGLANKIWGGVVGIIPGVDLLVQKFIIKKNAVKKVGKIFGIDVKFVEEDQKTINKEKDEEKNEIKDEENNEIKDEENIFNNPNLDKTSLKQIKEKDLTKESTKNKVCNGIKFTSETGAYVGSGFSIGTGVSRIASESILETTTIGLGVCGIGLGAVGVLVGVGVGGYLTHKYCENLIDKFVNYYKENEDKINNSYKEALKYFNQNKDDVEEGENILDYDSNIIN